MKVSHLSDIDFRVMVISMLKELTDNYKELNGNYKEHSGYYIIK